MRRHITDFREVTLEELAKNRVRKIRRFFNHLIIYAIALVIFIMKECFNAPFHFPPMEYINWFFMSCWAFILMVQGLKIFTKEVVLGRDWEKRQMDKIMKSDSDNQKTI